jgi:hypothetical protein
MSEGPGRLGADGGMYNSLFTPPPNTLISTLIPTGVPGFKRMYTVTTWAHDASDQVDFCYARIRKNI